MFAVDAGLVVETAGLRLRIDGRDSVLTCRVDVAAVAVLPILARCRVLLRAARALGPLLVRAGLRFDVLAGSVRVGQIGRGVEPNAPARLLRLPATRIGG